MKTLRNSLPFIVLALLVTQAAAIQVPLEATLTAPNQNGTNPVFRTDAGGVVPTTSTGFFSAILDTELNQLTDVSLSVVGMSTSDLRNFGPNSTPFHLHLPNSGNEGDFGFNVVDLVFGSEPMDLVDTADGFSFSRDSVSILAADQGAFQAAGVHPGDDVIVDRLLSGFPFVIVHSTKDVFTNDGAVLPNGMAAPVGFPFAELRGEVRAVPEPTSLGVWAALIGCVASLKYRRHR